MREIDAILEAFRQHEAQNQSCVLATVVHVEGSSYRRAGARMLVDEFGNMTGAISGGCLEGDALKKALLALHQNQNKLVTYDTSDENDAVIGAQLGCNGVIQVLYEPINFESKNHPLKLLEQAARSNDSHVIGTFFNLTKSKEQLGTLLLVNEHGEIGGRVDNEKLKSQVRKDAKEVLQKRTSVFREYKMEMESQFVFLEAFTPPPHLVLVGAGNDAQLLAQMANYLGWQITVTDGRGTHANSARFPSCSVVVTKPEHILEEVVINSQTAFVLMTHNYQYDLAVLKILLNEKAQPYVGILGPKKKFQRMLNELKADGHRVSEESLKRIYAPVGLNLGAETPAEIGLSILAEIQAVLTDSSANFLRENSGPIHQKKNNEFQTVILE